VHRFRSLVLVGTAIAAMAPALSPGLSPAHASTSSTHQVAICKRAPNGRVGCFAIRLDRYSSGRVQHASGPAGLRPSDLRSAYSLPNSGGSGQTIAIVDAYDDPTAEADLATYRSTFGLAACTTDSGCFRKVGQSGSASSLPSADAGWGQEISLDLDMASAACPLCHLLLVEATSSSQANLGAAVNTAVKLGATVVSNSYGGPDASDSSYGRYYHHPGVAITASSGDSGYGVSYPASSRWVTAVAGTSLSRKSNSSRGWSEHAWSGAGSGCSARNSAPSQSSSTTSCDGRAVADVAAVADPATGVAVFDSTPFQGTSGWLTFGGTSASAPIIAGVFALAGNNEDVADGGYVWKHHTSRTFNDVTSGSNGGCDTSRWCTARRGWDGPTGWGTPKGVSGF
jgi:subtilase family serine protease